MADIRHFLDIGRTSLDDLKAILDKAHKMKEALKLGKKSPKAMAEKQMALVFEKPSTRTRVSFEVAVNQLGGNAIMVSGNDSQLNRGETIADSARVLSRYVDIIMFRTFAHENLLEMAQNATVPVINGLTDKSHPCQVMADIMTFEEKCGSISGKKVAWFGDYNNMTRSWMEAAEKFNFNLAISCPKELLPRDVFGFIDTREAARDADLITTDTWVSMGDPDSKHKKNILRNYQVDDKIMALANKDAIFMHCLPAHRDEEVTASVMDGAKSVVWDEAENRLHIQKAIIMWCLGKI